MYKRKQVCRAESSAAASFGPQTLSLAVENVPLFHLQDAAPSILSLEYQQQPQLSYASKYKTVFG